MLRAAHPLRGPIILNRRAATRSTVTGVERWTAEVIPRLRALDSQRYRIAQPRPRLRRRAAAQSWEQAALPLIAARSGASLVFSPANLAPLAWPRNVIVLHDAAVLREPQAYSSLYRAWHARLGLTVARRAVKVITVSEFSRRELITLAGVRPESLAVIPGGVSRAFNPRADRRVVTKLGLRRPYVLTVATSDQRKNLSALSLAATHLRERGIDLVRAGDTRPYFSGSGQVPLRSIGYVEDADLPGLYAGALAFVLPSRYEGFGLTCLEAMACGTPVVAADRAALPETCGDAALLVDPDDEPAIDEAVWRCVTDSGTRERLIAAGLRRARRFTWERTAQQTHELLRAIIRS